jgi:hypothetical protein
VPIQNSPLALNWLSDPHAHTGDSHDREEIPSCPHRIHTGSV